MDLKARLDADMKSAMRSRDKERLSVIRLILSDIKNQEIKNKEPIKEDALLSLISRNAKQRRESISQFSQGGREDLVEKETRELNLLLEYLPSQLSPEELKVIIEKAIEETGATTAKEMGVVMKKVMSDVAGRADGKQVQQMVREILS
jgi:uncharacterized protein YqeY